MKLISKKVEVGNREVNCDYTKLDLSEINKLHNIMLNSLERQHIIDIRKTKFEKIDKKKGQ